MFKYINKLCDHRIIDQDIRTHSNKNGLMTRIMDIYTQTGLKRDNISKTCINFAE